MSIEDLCVVEYFKIELSKYQYNAETLNNKGLQKIYSNKAVWLTRLLNLVERLDKEREQE